MKPEPVTAAKVVAMINDLSPEALCSLVCFSSYLETKFRQLVVAEYCNNNLDVEVITNAWEADHD